MSRKSHMGHVNRMDHENRKRFAEYLFDEIGLIDDRYIAQAEFAYAPSSSARPAKPSWSSRRILITAVTLSLLLACILSVFVGNQLQKGAKEDAAPTAPMESMGNNSADNAGASRSTVSLRLQALRAETEHLRLSADSLPLFDGTPRIIWKYSDESGYRAMALSEQEKNQLLTLLFQNKGSRLSPETAEAVKSLDGIWIALGDGSVISPCLEQSAGNVGFGSLFEYDPELEPSSAFTEYLCDILS